MAVGRGDDTVGDPHRAQTYQLELFEARRAIRGSSISVSSTLAPPLRQQPAAVPHTAASATSGPSGALGWATTTTTTTATTATNNDNDNDNDNKAGCLATWLPGLPIRRLAESPAGRLPGVSRE